MGNSSSALGPGLASSIFGGGSSGGNQGGGIGSASVYVPQYQQQQDQTLQQLISSLTQSGANPGATTLPTVYGATNSIVQNPYINQMQEGANTAGADLGQIGATDRIEGQTLTQNANAALPYGNQILNTAFDPQQELYKKLLNQTEQQQNAQNAAMGIGTSGVGAGIQDQNLQNFNIGWQAQQLANQATGINAYDQLSSTAGNNISNAANLKSTGANLIAEGAALPYNTANVPGSTDVSAISNLSSAGINSQQIPQQAINDILAYLSGGTNASSVAVGSANTGYKNLSNEASGLGSLLGNSGGLSRILNALGLGADSGLPAGATDLGSELPWLEFA